MNRTAIRERLVQIFNTAGDDFHAAAEGLFNTLGYESDRAFDYDGTYEDFISEYDPERFNPETRAARSLEAAVKSIKDVFQITSEEISQSTKSVQGNLHGFGEVDEGRAENFTFVSVELQGDSYPRGQYAVFTRIINRLNLDWPTVILFKTTTNLVSLAFINRRTNKRDASRDVLGNVSLIREINLSDPHRAHLDILVELSLSHRLAWMDSNGKQHNFDGLLDAWLNTLDTEELNRRFYNDLFKWFNRAVDLARFPTKESVKLSSEEHIIRLITRMLFVWFIKEKGLVAEDLFIEQQVKGLLKDYDRATGDSYYRAILQNLFFATLNTEIGQRDFSSVSNRTYRNFSKYRFRKEIADEAALMDLFGQTPFINGGLFDCLDTEKATGDGGYRIDCFSDNVTIPRRREYGILSIPNRLFFGTDGLIEIFNHYKFTVEENTPAEQEVALDPELLGKAFENLLAAYNPETKETARKQTGSYYTPRAIVDYMVDEALAASISETVNRDDVTLPDKLRHLFDYSYPYDENPPELTDDESQAIVRAIAEVKILDPAVGSGAFPMSALHKLTLALRRLDERNELWESVQMDMAGKRAQAAFGVSNQNERDEELREISETFEKYRDSDYGRKLYLIQNSIYGVDIQPVATQIAKLRFFISLAIEQQTDPAADNYGIKPLPNLETRFVAANTLLGLGQPTQIPLGGENRLTELNDELRQNREQHFHAGVRREKLRLRREDVRLRRELAKELEKAGMAKSDAGKIADWDPYDQNSHADWFDAWYMFGVADGFDVVIGNPPYVESRNSLMSATDKDAYLQQVRADWGADLPRGSDLLIYFLARSAYVMNDKGLACLITQNAWLSTDYGKKFQTFTQGRFSFHRIIDTSARFFSDSSGPSINAIIAFFRRLQKDSIKYEIANASMVVTPIRVVQSQQDMKWGHLFAMPKFFDEILGELKNREDENLRGRIRFGQGVNVPKRKINVNGTSVPLLNSAHFVANIADSTVLKSAIGSRVNKIPALIMPRGVSRYYCAFNSCNAHSFSGVDLYLPNALWESDIHYCLWIYMNSSLVWLFREVTGRRNLGGGLLKAEATDMKTLPIGFDFDFADAAKDIHARLQRRVPMAIQEEVYSDEHLMIDTLIGEYFGISHYSDAIRDALLERVTLRETRAKHRG